MGQPAQPTMAGAKLTQRTYGLYIGWLYIGEGVGGNGGDTGLREGTTTRTRNDHPAFGTWSIAQVTIQQEGRTGAWVVHRPPQLACTVRAPPSPEALAAAPAPSAARRETTDTRTAARLPTAGSRWGPSERVFWGPPLVACGQWEAWGRRPPHGGLVRRVTASALALGW